MPTNKLLIGDQYCKTIQHWPAGGHASIDGFRGNWQMRDGLLTKNEERWKLETERRAYDILLSQAPFSFTLIKYGWMSKALQVSWPY